MVTLVSIYTVLSLLLMYNIMVMIECKLNALVNYYIIARKCLPMLSTTAIILNNNVC